MIGIADVTRRWTLDDVGQIADTPGSLVYRARKADGHPVVIILLKPRGMGEIAGMDYLAWREGHGSVRLLAREGNICLLEDAGSRTLEDLRQAEGEASAAVIFAAVLRRLHVPSTVPVPGDLVSLERHFAALIRGGIAIPAAHRANVAWAADVARALLAEQTDVMPLHGDLHHENILADADGHWRAIDPHGLVGEAAYDAANFFGNPLGRPDATCDVDRIRLLIRLLAPALGCCEEKVLRYAAAHAALSACWSIDDPVCDDDVGDAEHRLAFLAVARFLLT